MTTLRDSAPCKSSYIGYKRSGRSHDAERLEHYVKFVILHEELTTHYSDERYQDVHFEGGFELRIKVAGYGRQS